MNLNFKKSELGKRTPEDIVKDIEADHFARHLLMPSEIMENVLKTLYKNNGGPYASEDDIKKISKYFDVPEMQCFIRIQEITRKLFHRRLAR